MRVTFASNQLRRRFERSSEAMRAWGNDVGRKYIQRIQIIQAAGSFADLYRIRSLRLHPLKGPRKGEYAIDLTDRWRLIVTHVENELTVRIDEVSQHYDD